MSAPQRVQRRRSRGWRMPEGAVYVGRPSAWGNPFAVSRSSDFHGLPGSWFVRAPDGTLHHPQHDTQTSARRKAVELYAAQVLGDSGVGVEAIRAELTGHDLVCWCPRSEPCHADFLLQVANAPAVRPALTGCATCGRPAANARSGSVLAGAETAATSRGNAAPCPTCGAPRYGG